jgi:hypothetical protein
MTVSAVLYGCEMWVLKVVKREFKFLKVSETYYRGGGGASSHKTAQPNAGQG